MPIGRHSRAVGDGTDVEVQRTAYSVLRTVYSVQRTEYCVQRTDRNMIDLSERRKGQMQDRCDDYYICSGCWMHNAYYYAHAKLNLG